MNDRLSTCQLSPRMTERGQAARALSRARRLLREGQGLLRSHDTGSRAAIHWILQAENLAAKALTAPVTQLDMIRAHGSSPRSPLDLLYMTPEEQRAQHQRNHRIFQSCLRSWIVLLSSLCERLELLQDKPLPSERSQRE